MYVNTNINLLCCSTEAMVEALTDVMLQGKRRFRSKFEYDPLAGFFGCTPDGPAVLLPNEEINGGGLTIGGAESMYPTEEFAVDGQVPDE